MMTTLKDFLAKLQQNLNTLQEREAKYVGIAPIDLLNQIDDHKQTIALTEQVLQGELSEVEWREALKPLLVEIESRSVGEATSNVTIGDIEGGINDSIIAGRDVNIGQKITNFFFGSDEQRSQRNRQAMLKLVKDFWVKGVLETILFK